MEALQDQTAETGALSVLSFWHLQHCDTLTTCSSLLKETLLSPTDGIMSKDAFTAFQCDYVSRDPSEKNIPNTMFVKMRKILWILRELSFVKYNVSVEQIACENPSVGSKFAANYPSRHLHISTRISHILLSVGIFGHQLRELTHVWSQSAFWILKHIKMRKKHHRERFNRLNHLNVFLLNVINQQYFIQSDH